MMRVFDANEVPDTHVFGRVYPHLGPVDPVISVARDALVLPPGRTRAGTVLVAGRPFVAAGLVRDRLPSPHIALSAPDPAEGPVRPAQTFGTAIYGGRFFTHFGHFMLESLSRLWAASPLGGATDTRCPIIVHGDGPGLASALRGHVGDLLAAAGIDPARVIVARRPIAVDRLLVPWPLFTIRYSASRPYADFMAAIGATLAQGGCGGGPAIFLSRSKLNDGRIAPAWEQAAEAAFQRRGYDIVHPQELPLRDQAAVVRSARDLAGFAGSALHLVLFRDRPAPLRIIARGPRINANFLLISAIRGDAGSILFPQTAAQPTPDTIAALDRWIAG